MQGHDHTIGHVGRKGMNDHMMVTWDAIESSRDRAEGTSAGRLTGNLNECQYDLTMFSAAACIEKQSERHLEQEDMTDTILIWWDGRMGYDLGG